MINTVWTSDVARTIRAVISEKSLSSDNLDLTVTILTSNMCNKPFFKLESELGAFLGYMYFDGNEMYYELRAHMSGFDVEVNELVNAAICERQVPCCDTIKIGSCNLLLNGIPVIE